MTDWIECGKSWVDFQGTEPCRPGVLVCVRSGEGDAEYLIGDINPLGGICDCCMPFNYMKAVVLRYKELLPPTTP